MLCIKDNFAMQCNLLCFVLMPFFMHNARLFSFGCFAPHFAHENAIVVVDVVCFPRSVCWSISKNEIKSSNDYERNCICSSLSLDPFLRLTPNDICSFSVHSILVYCTSMARQWKDGEAIVHDEAASDKSRFLNILFRLPLLPVLRLPLL